MKKSPMRRVSKKRAKANAVYARKKAAYLEAHPICEVCHVHASTSLHHKKGRIGELLVDERWFLATDSTCHRMIEDNRTWAMEAGFSLDRLAI